jgi:hypothetical protein
MWEDRDFANYIVGQADADSSFVIGIQHYRGPRHGLKVLPLWVIAKNGEETLLRQIRDFLGVGRIHQYLGKSKPYYVSFQVAGRDCLKIVEFFEKFPLRSKKKIEYEIWKKAVEIYAFHEVYTRWTKEKLLQIVLLRQQMDNISCPGYTKRGHHSESTSRALEKLV